MWERERGKNKFFRLQLESKEFNLLALMRETGLVFKHIRLNLKSFNSASNVTLKWYPFQPNAAISPVIRFSRLWQVWLTLFWWNSQLHIKLAMLEVYWLYLSQAEGGYSNNSQTFSRYFTGNAISFYTLYDAIDHSPSDEFNPISRVTQGFIIISTAFPKYILSYINSYLQTLFLIRNF